MCGYWRALKQVHCPMPPQHWWTLDHSVVLCDREGLLPFAGARRGSWCVHVHTHVALRALGTGWGFHLVPQYGTRLFSRLLCCSPGRGTALLWVWGARLSTGLFVTIEKGQWISSASLGHHPAHRLGKRLVVWDSWCPDEALCTP